MNVRGAGLVACAVAAAAFAPGCHRDGCVGGDDGVCLPASACQALRYVCAATAGLPRVSRLGTDLERIASSPKALAAAGDFLLENDLVRVVLDAPEHPQGLAPTGGSIIDLAPTGARSGDQVNGFYQAAGLLPRDAVHYETPQIEEHQGQSLADSYVAVVFRGHLEGDRRVTVVTRYELHACEPGVRVTSDLFNGAPDPNTLYLADALFWGDRTLAPFVPGEGLGFRSPDLDLLHVDRAWFEWPFIAARSQGPPDVSYAVVPCDRPSGAGFNTTTLSAAGVPLSPTLPGDGIHYERFILAEPGLGLAPAIAEALNVRAMVHGDAKAVTVTGRVVAGGVPIDGGAGKAASLLFYEPAFGPDPDDEARRIPWNEAVPGSDGTFEVSLPPDRSYRVQPYAFGLPAAPATSFAVGHADRSGTPQPIGDLTLTASAHLLATVATIPASPPTKTFVELVVVPFDAPPPGTGPTFYGLFKGCNPMLGPPHGGSPACNRAVTNEGKFSLLVPPGEYYVYATRGPFATLDRAHIKVKAGEEVQVPLVLQDLPDLLPPGVVSGDFHVHGGASYDSSIPDQDRVLSFLSGGVDVIIATDHDVVTTYESTLAALDVSRQLVVIPGVEATPNILWFEVPGEDFPRTLGHFNFWPLPSDPTAPRNGAVWDELREPGQMMDDADKLFAGGVRQLNHPYTDTKLGRDQGFMRAIKYDPRTNIEPGASFAADVLLRAPGGLRRNLDFDVQEVMTGASREDWLRYRALWFSLLSQGILRAGAANSDTHTLSVERVGYPRNLIFGDQNHRAALEAGTFDTDAFDADVRAGHMVGTNGPVLDVTIEDGGTIYHPSLLQPIKVSPSANLLVSVTAAPWIPVTEVRVIVNGQVMTRISTTDLTPPEDAHFRAAVGTFNTGPIPLSMLAMSATATAPATPGLPAKGDAWLIVEAGMQQDDVADTDDDGLPDLVVPDDAPTRPPPTDLRFDLEAVAPGVWPTAFSNPFLLDLDGGGWKAPGLPSSGTP